MTKKDIIRKLTSRKFWVTIVSNAIGIFTLLTASDNAEVQVIASIALIVCTNVAYILGESKIDAIGTTKSIIATIEEIKKIVEKYEQENNKELPNNTEETSDK